MPQLGRLQEELDALAAEIGHSLSIDDPDGRLIAYSTQGPDADPARIAAILSRRVAPDVLAWEQRHGIAEATGPVRLPANPDLGMTARLCVPIRHDRRCLGYLWVLGTGSDLDDTAIAAVARFERAMAPVLDPRWSGVPHPTDRDVNSLIRALLGKTPVPEALDQLAAAVPGLLGSRVRACAVVPVAREGEGVREFTGTEFQRLNAALPAGLRPNPWYVGSFVSAGHAVVLIRHWPAADVIAEIDKIAARDGGTATTLGISEPAPFGAEAARTAYAQALAAAELAALDPALPSPLSWQDLGPYRTLLQLARPPSPGTSLTPLDEAGSSGPMFLRTLETYLDFGGDAQQTAERLHLHRTSLYYRLRRIADLLDADLADGLTRLDLHLALKCRRLARRRLG